MVAKLQKAIPLILTKLLERPQDHGREDDDPEEGRRSEEESNDFHHGELRLGAANDRRGSVGTDDK
jgi:hypothetical protein